MGVVSYPGLSLGGGGGGKHRDNCALVSSDAGGSCMSG